MAASKTPARESPHLTEPGTSILTDHRADELARRLAREHTEALLDEALSETFPASDPIAIPSPRQGSK